MTLDKTAADLTSDLVARYGSMRAAAKALNIPRATLQRRYQAAQSTPEKPRIRVKAGSGKSKPFNLEDELPSSVAPVEDIISRRMAEFARVSAAKEARKLINVVVNMEGPIGVAHLGDPHLDDPGTDIALLSKHIDTIRNTEGLFGANLGDNTNNWIGRLARLYGEQSTSAAEAWMLTEWMVSSVRWLYLIKGNHDVWSGAGDPLNWIMRGQPGAFEADGTRINLKFPNGRQVRINARHDFKGHSMWNAAHGVNKAAQMGWRDHILIAGHLHVSGYNILKDPSTGLISHAIRVASYKTYDRYASQLGLPDQNISECVTTIIDPEAPDERRLVTVLMDPEEAADYLTFKRAKWAAGKMAS